MRPLFSSGLSVLLLWAAIAAGAQVPNPNQNGQSAGSPPGESAAPADAGRAPATPTTTKPEVTVTAPPVGPPLPELAPDEFTHCYGLIGYNTEQIDYTQAVLCENQLSQEKHTVVEACINRSGNTALPRVIQACTESLDHNIFEGNARFFLFANRAAAYFAQGDKQHALDDFNEAVKLAPRNADVYYNRGVFYIAQSDNDSALRDFDAALAINPKHLPSLRKRAKIYQIQGNLSAARIDYSDALSLQPKAADLWNERACLYLSLIHI